MKAETRQAYDAVTARPFVIRYTNVDSVNPDRFVSIAEAATVGRRIGFEFSVHEECPVKGSRMCGSWEVFRGWRDYPGSFHKEAQS